MSEGNLLTHPIRNNLETHIPARHQTLYGGWRCQQLTSRYLGDFDKWHGAYLLHGIRTCIFSGGGQL